MSCKVVNVSRSDVHNFSKDSVPTINLIAGFGVEGDAHAGKNVQHLFLVKKDPHRKNIRQVHLIPSELLAEVAEKGFEVKAGELGENITTAGLDLINLPVGSQLRFANNALIEVTALRNPCPQINQFQPGLLKEMAEKDTQGKVIRKAGVMAVVIEGGVVNAGDTIEVIYPDGPHTALEYIW